MVRLLRLLRGYVVFAVTGSCPERFINTCIYNGVNVWGVRSKEGVVYCSALAANYKTIKSLSRHRSVTVRLKRKRGLPFILNRNKKRVGLLIGAACFMAILKVLSLFVWNIDITGGETISTFQARETMRDVGIYEGMYGKVDSVKNIQTWAMIEFGNVSWLTVNLDGSYGEVNITESVAKGEIANNTKPSNIKADCDAQIIRVDVYSGAPAVVSGDAVVKGNLLISGVVSNEQGGLEMVRSDGVVWARTAREESFNFPAQYSFADYSDEPLSRYSCKIFNIVFPLTGKCIDKDQTCFYIINENRAQFNGNTASLSLINESIYPYEITSAKLSESEADSRFSAEKLLCELFNYSDRDIISADVEKAFDGENYSYTVAYECEENIGEESEIIIDDSFVIDNESLENVQTDTDEYE